MYNRTVCSCFTFTGVLVVLVVLVVELKPPGYKQPFNNL